jgi:hypothetical protein
MLRFRNPGTQYSTQIQVIKQLYEKLGAQSSFTLNDMASVIAQGRLMTAYGYAGDNALKLSNKDQKSMNSALMNAKMYAEVFRMLGWITPYGDKSYPLVFTYIGIHVALSSGDCSLLYEQCVLGINNPTEFSGRMHYDERVRFFKCALRSFIDLDGIMYKYELCLGPMSVNDINEDEYAKMIKKIRNLRGNYSKLHKSFLQLANNLGMKPTPVDNCTRFPIAVMKSCQFIESVQDKSLYNRSLSCLRITSHGRETFEKINDMKDMRLEEFAEYDEETKKSLIRLGIYSMLQRSGYELSSVKNTMANDVLYCKNILAGKELLFSPYQTIRREKIEQALNITIGNNDGHPNIATFKNTESDPHDIIQSDTWALDISHTVASSLLTKKEDRAFINQINDFRSKDFSKEMMVNSLFDSYINATQSKFYPLIATLFKVMGYKCVFSRPGDNGARWDAIIIDDTRSIPIEIKSPTEEQHLSIKAIRQALENKIVLLSRKTHITAPDVTTLAVGYYMPNKRAEVRRLISDIKATYGYKVGVIDLKSLLSISISILVDSKGFDKEKLYGLEGLLNENL